MNAVQSDYNNVVWPGLEPADGTMSNSFAGEQDPWTVLEPQNFQANTQLGSIQQRPTSFSDYQMQFEVDSDDSWTTADHEEEWQFHYQDQLAKFLSEQDCYAYLTPSLNSKHRKRIHAMAHLRRLSHMSLGAGKEKRVLVTKCEINTSFVCRNRWNAGRGHLKAGAIDPRIITISNSRYLSSPAAAWQWLSATGLPSPLRIDSERYLDNSGPPQSNADMRAIFADSLHAAAAYVALQAPGATPTGSDSVLGYSGCHYTLFVACGWEPDDLPHYLPTLASIRVQSEVDRNSPHDVISVVEPEHNIYNTVRRTNQASNICGTCGKVCSSLEHLRMHQRSHTETKPFTCADCTRSFARQDLLLHHQQKLHTDLRQPDENRRPQLSLHIRDQRIVPMHRKVTASDANDDIAWLEGSAASLQPIEYNSDASSASSQNVGYSNIYNDGSISATSDSLSSAIHSDYGSDVSAAKRKRLPVGNYECSFGCGKAFSHAGDRTKHERIHQTERPYPCGVCSHGFMYPKDLRRHEERTGHRGRIATAADG